MKKMKKKLKKMKKMKKIKVTKNFDALILLENKNLVFLSFFQKSFSQSKYFSHTFLRENNKVSN